MSLLPSNNSPVGLFLVTLLVGIAGALVLPRNAAAQQISDTAPPPPPGDEEPPPPQEAQPPNAPPDRGTFETRLAPYGRWVDMPQYGRVWIPNEAVRSDWQPYTDGRWVWTDAGWSFDASVPWGWAAFHYGRWGFTADLGWFWVPGYVWAPAWVSWRIASGHYCWSPYGPQGFVYGGRWPGWVVVPREQFRYPIARVVLPQAHAREIVRAARPAHSIEKAPQRGHQYGPPRAEPKDRRSVKRGDAHERGEGHQR